MDKQHLTHVKNNMVYCLNNYMKVLKDWDFSQFSFDTESCQKFRGCNKSAKVYSWSLGCVNSDKQIYGLDLNHFFKLMYVITDYHFNNVFKRSSVKKNKDQFIRIPIAVHNLGWDLEFLKYHLMEVMGYEYRKATIETILKPSPHQVATYKNEDKTFHIVQSDNVVYSLEVTLPTRHRVTRRTGKGYNVTYVLDFWDSYKVMTCPISKIDSFCKDINPMFNKLGDNYDYETFRERGQKPTDTELRYLYNDVYRLNKALEQFYIPLCNQYNLVNKRTASGMAFEILKQFTFKSEKYNQEYREYFEIDKFTGYEDTRKRMEKYSYQGGYTHANHTIIDRVIYEEGCSFDINSSYPSQMAYKLMPYGKPIKIMDKHLVPFDNINNVAIIEIGFDSVRPKKKMFDLPVFKIGGMNSINLREIYGDVSGNEYFSTNMIGNRCLPVYRNIDSNLDSNYQLCITSIEYDFFIKHFEFGHFSDDIINPTIVWDGLEIGKSLLYKAEKGKVNDFIQYFTKMKVAFKGRTKEKVKADLLEDKNYYVGLLSEEEVQQALKEGIKKDPVKVAFAKLELNSSYGKFGTKTLRNETTLIKDNDGIIRNATLRDGEELTEYETQEFYRPYASFVTANGRLQLWNTIIYAIGVDNFLYCDTDSIYTRGNPDDIIQRMNDIGETVDSTILGKWDLETHFNSFKALGQKKYMLHLIKENKYKLKCCGLPSNAQKILASEGYKNFYLGVEVEGKKQRMRVQGGALLLNVKYKIQKVMFS